MKKIFLVFTLFLIGLAVKANTNIAKISLHSITPSTSSSGFELQFLASLLPSSGCYGNFTVAFQRKLTTSNSWVGSDVTMTPVTNTTTTNIASFSKLYKISQLEGMKYDYRVIITFNPQTGGAGCSTAPNLVRTSSSVIVATPKACFNIINPSTSFTANSPYGNQTVNEIGFSTGDVTIDASCSANANGYFVRVTRFNLSNWTVDEQQSGEGEFYNGWIDSSVNPSNINLNTLIGNNNKNFEDGKIYLVSVSVGPVWHSAQAKFIKINFAGRAATSDLSKNKEVMNNQINLNPNPVTDKLNIDLNSTKVLKVNVYDLLGKLITSFTPSKDEQKLEIDFSSYNSGTYLLQMETENGVKTEKIIKQ